MQKYLMLLSLSVLVLGGCPGSEDGGPVGIVSFTASPAEVEPGGTATLTWDTRGARTIDLYAFDVLADGTESAARQVVPESTRVDGTAEVTIARMTRFVLTAYGENRKTAEVTVNVTGGGTPDVVVEGFFVQPTAVAPDEPATLFWVTGNADYVTIESRPRRVPVADWESEPGEVEPTGQMEIREFETTEFRITATGNDMSVYRETTLQVFAARPERPEITSFTATPPEINQGEASLLAWTTTNATVISGLTGVSAGTVNGSVEVTPTRTTRYTLRASRDGFLDFASVTVRVNAIEGAPAIESFTADPGLLGQGATTRLYWDTTNVDDVDIEPSVVAGGSPDGSIDVTPGTTTEYILTATGPLGQGQASLTVTVVPVGGLVISEIMDDPLNVSDSDGSWIEVYNTTADDIFLTGLEISDAAGSHIVFGDAAVASGGYFVLGGNDDSLLNGGATIDYQWSTISLDDADTFTLSGGTVDIDSVAYVGAWPSVEGTSMEVDTLDAGANDNVASWCAATTGYGADGNSGTPGFANDCP